MKTFKYLLALALFGGAGLLATSCDDMLDKGNDNVRYADEFTLNSPSDTITSLLGILGKLQAIGVRNNLLGEVRADLVDVNLTANTDLKALARFEADVQGDEDANQYNVPRDYYAVINNCNFFLAHADSLAGNVNRNERYFKREIAQVHSIRAWTYLQLVLAYGRVPLVLDPVVTKLQSDAQYEMADLQRICDVFINDLRPYYGAEYPDPRNFGGGIHPSMTFFPTQLVMGDLYLYQAAALHDREAAKKAAKSYYDFIKWDLSNKKNTFTGSGYYSWDAAAIKKQTYKHPTSVSDGGSATSWGDGKNPNITMIAMDSAAVDGHYNELRNLYNTITTPDVREASISPSQAYKDLSTSQRYITYDENKDPFEVTSDKMEQEELEKGYAGDLRYQGNFATRDVKYNSKEIKSQTIAKFSPYASATQHITIYRAPQVYLRLAEAFNYAGYPRMARVILTMGLSNNVIQNEALPFYPSTADSAYLASFDFPTIDFKAYAENYATVYDQYDVPTSVTFTARTDYNMLGIHNRGCGYAFLNPDYCTLETPDSTGFPVASYNEVGTEPQRSDYVEDVSKPKTPAVVGKPSTWDKYPGETVTREVYETINPEATTAIYNKYTRNDSVGKYKKYIEETLPEYEAKLAEYNAAVAANDKLYSQDSLAYEDRLGAFLCDYKTWYNGAYTNEQLIAKEQKTVDEAILTEQALEMAYEGNRFFDLMRRALWYGDNNILVEAVSKRDPAVGAKLANKANWFLHWKGQIGY